ncbi:hypothetical protein PoB_007410000 [Plakobranchus ocellatus]|uniref:Uncharacterized protein n=1 Tax=Plakobranchus ocellatus TaxID=259542 RepID=A0AAV4DU84_9GAST|nr:hypothetical protein PoB_007410000 [Plakobranchus ocellatus]
MYSGTFSFFGLIGGAEDGESALTSAGTLLSRGPAPPRAPWPVGRPESLSSLCCGLAIYQNQTVGMSDVGDDEIRSLTLVGNKCDRKSPVKTI